MLTLVIGDKTISSWSLRPWLALKAVGEPFEERLIRLYRPGFETEIAAISGAGKVPVLIDGAVTVWDSLAICEYLAERYPAANLWPEPYDQRARARSMAAEMHAGFAALRRELPMDILARQPGKAFSPETQADIDRIVSLWREQRATATGDGPFLFGGFTIADAFFAPVATRFRTYGVDLPPVAQTYADALLGYPPMREWERAAEVEASGA